MSEDLLELKVEGFAFGGRAFGRLLDGRICFARGAAPGETALVRLTSMKSSYATASLARLVQSSPLRIDCGCPLAPMPQESHGSQTSCPGCSYRHVPYSMELEWKSRQFADFIERNAGLHGCKQESPCGAEARDGWRNKLTLSCESPLGQAPRLGYFAEDNRTLIEVPECPLAHPDINRLLKKSSARESFRLTLKDGVRVKLRHTQRDGAIVWTGKARHDGGWLLESLPQGEFLVPRDSFFQVNTAVASKLFDKASGIFNRIKPEMLAELYCGVGPLSILAAKSGVPKIVGVELDAKAVDAARVNAQRHSVERQCEFRQGDAGRLFNSLLKKGAPLGKSLLVLDPPRAGLERSLAERIASSRIRHILCISCSPDTLARDLRILHSGGYRMRETGIFDMFPGCAHFESFALLELDA